MKYLKIFILSFFLNLFWEHAHSFLYASYRGGGVTELVLSRAALFDAVYIVLISWLFFNLDFLKNRLWLSIIFGVIFSISLELFALKTGRWDYGPLMPIIPLFGAGITPSIQLGLLSWLCLTFFRK